MRLEDCFYQDGVLDCYTFVFDEVDPKSGYRTMLGMSEDGRAFSQWTSGVYDPNDNNEHLGQRVNLWDVGSVALNALYGRLSIPRGAEDLYITLDEIAKHAQQGADDYDEPEEPELLDQLDDLRRTLKHKHNQRQHPGE